MKRHITILLLLAGWSGACDPNDPQVVEPTPQTPVASVTISPDTADVLVGSAVQFRATVRDASGNVLNDRSVVWSSSDSTAVLLAPNGMAQGLRAGRNVTIRASSEGQAGSASLHVLSSLARLGVNPPDTVLTVGDSMQLRVVLLGGLGDTLPSATDTVWWRSSYPSVAKVSATGSVTGVGPGTAIITAGVNGTWKRSMAIAVSSGATADMSGEWDWSEHFASGLGTCSDTGTYVLPQSGTVDLGSSTQVGSCTNQQGQLYGNDHSDSVTAVWVVGQAVAFQVGQSCSYVATVESERMNGLAVCQDSVLGTWEAHRPWPLANIQLGTIATTNLLVGATVRLSTTLSDTAGQRVFRAVTWTSDNDAVATVSDSGVVSAVARGTATISASVEGHSATASFVVGALSLGSVSAGDTYSCALALDGAAYCWGSLGSRGPEPQLVEGGHQFTALTTGDGFACGLDASGAAWCFGDNGSGQLGNGSTTASDVPTAVAGGLQFIALSAGAGYACGLSISGVAYCWGFNGIGQLGNGTTAPSVTPVAVSGGIVFTALLAGDAHTCGLTASGAAYCWGDNRSGQLGDGTNTGRRLPTAVVTDSALASISAGSGHTCALTPSGAAFCWGDNQYGQLGIGSGNAWVPRAVSGGLTFQSVAAGFTHSCGVATGGTAWCWGDNQSGQLGTGNATASATPVAVTGGLSFGSITTGGSYVTCYSSYCSDYLVGHTCGITTDGVAYCWGDNEFGQIGKNDWYSSSVPVKVFGQ
jgi:alpha-tubulin suppressor-like RCC1 family protein